MKRRTTDDIIEKLAKKEGVSGSTIREEMKKAILSAYTNSKDRLLWDSLFGEGQLPSPEEFIMALSSAVVKGTSLSLVESHSLQKSGY